MARSARRTLALVDAPYPFLKPRPRHLSHPLQSGHPHRPPPAATPTHTPCHPWHSLRLQSCRRPLPRTHRGQLPQDALLPLQPPTAHHIPDSRHLAAPPHAPASTPMSTHTHRQSHPPSGRRPPSEPTQQKHAAPCCRHPRPQPYKRQPFPHLLPRLRDHDG